MQITLVAGQGQVLQIIPTSMLPGDNVFDVENVKRLVHLMEAAVLTAVSRSSTRFVPVARPH